jgi:hypothetical protein
VKLQTTSRRPCELERGQARRVPQNPGSGLVGYHLCCPRCGYVTVALHGAEELTIAENEDRTEVTLSRPVRCIFCKVQIGVIAGDIELIEDEHVRDVRYR